MTAQFPISAEEEVAVQQLGGPDNVINSAERILREHGIARNLFSPSERRQIHLGRGFTRRQVEFHFDTGKSLRANIGDLLRQAGELQATAGGTNYVGLMLQHLVGAKLDIVLGEGRLKHHGSSVADQPTGRHGDFQVERVAIHVTTHPSEALISKCANNLRSDLKPLIITIAEAVEPAEFLLKNANLADRVDVLDAAQFLTANIYERSLFKTTQYKVTLTALLERYNAIVTICENDPSLLIKLGPAIKESSE